MTVIVTAFQTGAFQEVDTSGDIAFQMVRTFVRTTVSGKPNQHKGLIPVGALRVITIKTVKNKRVE